jgi:excisionase family DNA binding protein
VPGKAGDVPTTPASDSRWVTLGRACEILGVDESTLRRWADSGRLRMYRTPGGHRRFALTNLQELVAGQGKPPQGEIGRLAFAKIRSEIRRVRQQEGGWYASVSNHDRDQLRDLGRRLLEMVSEYMTKKKANPAQLEEARRLGLEYGHILSASGMPLASAVEAYIGFRKQMDETTRRASLPAEEALDAYGQVHALGDQVLLGIAAIYEDVTADPLVV